MKTIITIVFFFLYMFFPIILAALVFYLWKGWRWKISSGLSLLFSAGLFVFINIRLRATHGSQLHAFDSFSAWIFYPAICMVVFMVLFVLEWMAWWLRGHE